MYCYNLGKYPWRSSDDCIECIVGHPFPVYQSINHNRLLEFILYSKFDMGSIRFSFHGDNLQAIFERKSTRLNEMNNKFIYISCMGDNIRKHFTL